MVGLGMIFDETYRPFFERAQEEGIYRKSFGPTSIELGGIVTRTGHRAARYLANRPKTDIPCDSFVGEHGLSELLQQTDINVVCVATPDDRHFDVSIQAIRSGKHVLIEKPSVLTLVQLDQLQAAAEKHQVLVKVVYHKLLDPDHKKLRTHVANGILQHVNNGYCSLLEPKSISGSQFAEWITGRNPSTYVAVHYIKLIDFTFHTDWQLHRITATGQRGLVDSPTGPTWDSNQIQVIYRYPDGREAAFDIHTSWVNPDNFPGYVDQEVQFRFDNGIWNAHQRKRGVEIAVEHQSPNPIKYTPNHHYNGSFIEPWGDASQRGYGIEVIERFFEEVAFVEFGGKTEERRSRLEKMQKLDYNDIRTDRNTVAIVQAVEAVLEEAVQNRPGSTVFVNHSKGGLVLFSPGISEPRVLYAGQV
ncbi:oxidoreductase domain protein : Putative dehydrogenase OS=Planctomyces maris DSM 8797 GN=PM8797T_18639 PE=4 SV=1: GFO_IDH_MocA [Tuwongella immobilis]|uniref:Gfo/Idh/MocA-like oxidoreductase N-terminal domain-containing protein n=2 Tax=Tuwongella immobilis TaxID=692036 RepID=A0A6C2YP25_9BACT|nr:oxidoreductase domain protein : Putative dehydrogenase OS=Planctomyces maris DSM 8797 GN=PM8797T_18639 PE=4 SV=1: GFO_IDH_MocA [Tuwongella immobilis]VTS03439.1 oxidoreductase domain protein : Putative dehydrogenase OS=Planctomyces maris DSM 8797 GN=PM8797T_18639 PE=4 SV=1: GFO_IDH_MocA [Tuwongella immobilis]